MGKFDMSHWFVIPCSIAASVLFAVDGEWLSLAWSANCGIWCVLHAIKQ